MSLSSSQDATPVASDADEPPAQPPASGPPRPEDDSDFEYDLRQTLADSGASDEPKSVAAERSSEAAASIVPGDHSEAARRFREAAAAIAPGDADSDSGKDDGFADDYFGGAGGGDEDGFGDEGAAARTEAWAGASFLEERSVRQSKMARASQIKIMSEKEFAGEAAHDWFGEDEPSPAAPPPGDRPPQDPRDKVAKAADKTSATPPVPAKQGPRASDKRTPPPAAQQAPAQQAPGQQDRSGSSGASDDGFGDDFFGVGGADEDGWGDDAEETGGGLTQALGWLNPLSFGGAKNDDAQQTEGWADASFMEDTYAVTK